MSADGMLVLSRKRDESIIIGGQIEVVVVDVRGDKVRLGFKAPREVTIDRKEVWVTKQKEAEEQSRVKNT